MRALPIGQPYQTFRKQSDIESEFPRLKIDVLFLGREQIDQQRSPSRPIQDLGNVPIARTEPAAPAAVGKHDEPGRLLRDSKISDQVGLPEQNLDTSFLHAGAPGPRVLRACVDKSFLRYRHVTPSLRSRTSNPELIYMPVGYV